MSDYPEHDKASAISDASQAVGEFLDTCGFTLCEWREAGNNGDAQYIWKEGVETSGAQGGTPTTDCEPNSFDYFNDEADENPGYDEWLDGFYPVPGSIQRILAGHFGIDLDVLNDEKRAMLEAIRTPK